MVWSGGTCRAERRSREGLLALGLSGVTLALMLWAYAGIWTAGPVWEDHNSAVAHEDAILERSSPLVDDWVWYRRPITTASYRLTNNLGGGQRAAHLLSLGLHLAVVAAVAAFALTVGASPWIAGAVMALHPLASEAVVYLSARSELLSTLLVVLTLLALCRGRILVGAIMAGLSFGCNPATAAALLGLIPLCLWCGWIDPWWKTETLTLTAVLALAVTAGALQSWNTPEVTQAGPWLPHLARQLAGTVTLARLVVLPWPLVVDHSVAWQAWGAVAGRLAVLTGVTGAALALRRRMPWLAVLTAWWIVGFGARLWLPSWNFVTEHHAYLPLVGVALIAGEWAA